MVWGDYLSFEYGKPVKDKQSIDGNVPVFGTNGQIGTSHLPPLCKIPSFVVGRKGAYRGVHYSSVPFSVIDTAFYALPLTDKVDLKWAYYKFLTYDINRMDSGSAIPSTDRYELYKIEVEIPSLETQKKIVSVLDVFENIIRVNSEINENLLQQARALFRKWFSITSSGLYKLSDIADINPETYSPKENWSFVNYLDTSNITSGTINEVQYIIPSEEKLPSRARRILRKDDVVFSTVRPNQLHYGIISNPKPNMLGSTGFAVIRSKYETIPNEIIYLALTESAFVEQMQQLAEQSVSTFPSIRPADLDACVLPEPKEDDNNFMETIKSIFNAVAINNEENQRLATLRDTLLPRLMSGELDVSSLDF